MAGGQRTGLTCTHTSAHRRAGGTPPAGRLQGVPRLPSCLTIMARAGGGNVQAALNKGIDEKEAMRAHLQAQLDAEMQQLKDLAYQTAAVMSKARHAGGQLTVGGQSLHTLPSARVLRDGWI
jgi:hypothetical protein